jgi:hypothetical protein
LYGFYPWVFFSVNMLIATDCSPWTSEIIEQYRSKIPLEVKQKVIAYGQIEKNYFDKTRREFVDFVSVNRSQVSLKVLEIGYQQCSEALFLALHCYDVLPGAMDYIIWFELGRLRKKALTLNVHDVENWKESLFATQFFKSRSVLYTQDNRNDFYQLFEHYLKKYNSEKHRLPYRCVMLLSPTIGPSKANIVQPFVEARQHCDPDRCDDENTATPEWSWSLAARTCDVIPPDFMHIHISHQECLIHFSSIYFYITPNLADYLFIYDCTTNFLYDNHENKDYWWQLAPTINKEATTEQRLLIEWFAGCLGCPMGQCEAGALQQLWDLPWFSCRPKLLEGVKKIFKEEAKQQQFLTNAVTTNLTVMLTSKIDVLQRLISRYAISLSAAAWGCCVYALRHDPVPILCLLGPAYLLYKFLHAGYDWQRFWQGYSGGKDVSVPPPKIMLIATDPPTET